jgi:hypothetical protein
MKCGRIPNDSNFLPLKLLIELIDNGFDPGEHRFARIYVQAEDSLLLPRFLGLLQTALLLDPARPGDGSAYCYRYSRESPFGGLRIGMAQYAQNFLPIRPILGTLCSHAKNQLSYRDWNLVAASRTSGNGSYR